MGVEDLQSALSSDCLYVDPETIINQKCEVPFEELKKVEKRRRQILKRTELPFWRILCYFEGTCLKAMLVDWLLWVTFIVYVGLRIILRNENILPGAVDFGNTDIRVIGGFLSFFLVLFVNQSNTRFIAMYMTSQNCPKRIFDIAEIILPSFPKANASRIVRYLNAAHVAGYVGLSRTYSQDQFFNKLNDRLQFLNEEELNRIRELDMDHGPEAFHELVNWCMQDIETAYKKNFIDPREKSALKDKATQFRSEMDGLYQYCDQPVHFFYIHFLCLLSAVYLPLFAADSAFSAGMGENLNWTWDILSGLIVLVQAVFVIGLRLLGQKMSDPFGDDLEDLSVLTYLLETWKLSNNILETQSPAEAEASIEKEAALKNARQIGAARGAMV